MKKRDDVYISQILSAISRVKGHLRGVPKSKFFKSDLHKAAVVRELQVIGEATKLISLDSQAKYHGLPWSQIIGMRNRLVHEYFNIDDSIVWEVATLELPTLEAKFESMYLGVAPAAHPWRECPIGYHHVSEFLRDIRPSKARLTGGTSQVRSHCRKNPTGKDQLYPDEIKAIVARHGTNFKTDLKVGKLAQPNNANEFDRKIVFWCEYWGEVFGHDSKFDPDVIKALFFSESSFNLKVSDVRARKGNFARGPMQIIDSTRKVLADEKGELKDHYLTLSASDIRDVDIALAAAVRWLYQKRKLASSFLGRPATGEEVIAEYKGVLRKSKDFKSIEI